MSIIHEVATMTAKGQITVPKPIRQALGADLGTKVAFELLENGRVAPSSAAPTMSMKTRPSGRSSTCSPATSKPADTCKGSPTTSLKSCSNLPNASEIFNDLAVVFDGQYFAQIRRYYDELSDLTAAQESAEGIVGRAVGKASEALQGRKAEQQIGRAGNDG